MALSSSASWFQSWSPPSQLYTDNYYHKINHFDTSSQSERNFRRHNGDKEGTTSMLNYLPYIFSLGLVSSNASPQTRYRNIETRPLERTGPFKTWYAWKQMDFDYPTESERIAAIDSGEFVPENNLPLGIEVYKDRLFVSLPKWKDGVPATLAVLPIKPLEPSPKMVPYPNWEFHSRDDCTGLTSVYRMEADECGRLWVLDSGQIEVTIKPKQVCPPQVFIFDMETDKLLLRYPLPEEFIKQDSLYSNIRVDIREGQCDDAYAYLTDVWRFGLVVFSLDKMRSWRITDHLFYPDPLAAAYSLHGLDFEWTDGIFGMALSPVNKRTNERILYFHPMSSFREFYVKTSVLRNETGWFEVKDAFTVIGQSRGKSGHASASALDRNAVYFYNQVTRDSVACWDTRKPYTRNNLGLVAYSNETMVFPNDLKIDNEKRQSLWIITNKLPFYLYRKLDPREINFRIMSAYADEAVKGGICDPNVRYNNEFNDFQEVEECY